MNTGIWTTKWYSILKRSSRRKFNCTLPPLPVWVTSPSYILSPPLFFYKSNSVIVSCIICMHSAITKLNFNETVIFCFSSGTSFRLEDWRVKSWVRVIEVHLCNLLGIVARWITSLCRTALESIARWMTSMSCNVHKRKGWRKKRTDFFNQRWRWVNQVCYFVFESLLLILCVFNAVMLTRVFRWCQCCGWVLVWL